MFNPTKYIQEPFNILRSGVTALEHIATSLHSLDKHFCWKPSQRKERVILIIEHGRRRLAVGAYLDEHQGYNIAVPHVQLPIDCDDDMPLLWHIEGPPDAYVYAVRHGAVIVEDALGTGGFRSGAIDYSSVPQGTTVCFSVRLAAAEGKEF